LTFQEVLDTLTILQQPIGSWLVATQIFFMFTPKIGEDEPILTKMFQMGWSWNHQLDRQFIPLFAVQFFTSPVVQDFFHQQ